MKKVFTIATLALAANIAMFHTALTPIYAAPAPQEQIHTDTSPTTIAAGNDLFQRNCAFCHGRDAEGGETGPDLTRSTLVEEDVNGNKIADIVRNGRIDTLMPAFKFTDQEMTNVVSFIHAQRLLAMSESGKRRGVDVSDLQTGDAAAGKRYFDGPGGCAGCHSATGDLAHVATRYQGLRLEERMLYPGGVKSKATVTLPSGQTITGVVSYLDEFTLGITDQNGSYHSWPIDSVKHTIQNPLQAHIAQFPKYTDDDIHNLMAYMQTLR